MAKRPVSTRLEEGEIARLEAAVKAGDAPDRASAIEEAVAEWNERHDRARITDGYQRADNPAHGGTPLTDDELGLIRAANQRSAKRWLDADR